MPPQYQKPTFPVIYSDMFVVAVVSNTPRFRRRYELFEKFKAQLITAQMDFVVVELAFGDRPFAVTHANEPFSLQLRTHEEFWHKENLINLGIAHGRKLWPNKKRVGWIDADCEPVGRTFREWFEETWHELQHYEFVQMWEYLQPLDYHYGPLGSSNPSFMSNYIKFGTPYPVAEKGYPTQWGSPGLAWAANFGPHGLDGIGGLPDVAVLGAGDWYLAHALITDLPFRDMNGYTPEYRGYWQRLQDRCEKWVKRDVGYVRGLFAHFFHGKIVNRGYNTRENILITGKFNPLTDLKRDHQGLWQLETHEPRQIWMRDKIRLYFRARSEDEIS